MQNILVPTWPAPHNVRAFTTLRNSPADIFTQLSGIPKHLKQTHSTIVVCADDVDENIPEADASVAFKPNHICVVRTADCLPILLCDKQGTQVAAIHAGWRGLAAGIITNTCQRLTAPSEQLLAWLGPAIGSQAFEVEQDVPDTFVQLGWKPGVVREAFTPSTTNTEKSFGNLYFLARHALQQYGLTADNIYGGELCTFSDPERFYSYRRSEDASRMSTLIWLE